MQIYKNIKTTQEALTQNPIEKIIDQLVHTLQLSSSLSVRKKIFQTILARCRQAGIIPSSINDFYLSQADQPKDFTVPAINLRGLTYLTAQTIFQTIREQKIAFVIFELARSEMGYTDQPPIVYAGSILAAALKENYSGPVFLQLDHAQVKIKKFQEDPEKEMTDLKNIIQQSVEAGFYNIDIDASTMVNLSKSTVIEQQRKNAEITAELTKFIRQIQGEEITISIGGEIGEIGEKNSTPEELKAFLDKYNEMIGENVGLSKISIQSGATHGGKINSDGSIVKAIIDFNLLKQIGDICKQDYQLGGVVQHGASTLPENMFNQFPENKVLEVHLATQFQNLIFDHVQFPNDLKKTIYAWLKQKYGNEQKDLTDEQFYYKFRKKSWGEFKKQILFLDKDIQTQIQKDLKEKFITIFKQLNLSNTQN